MANADRYEHIIYSTNPRRQSVSRSDNTNCELESSLRSVIDNQSLHSSDVIRPCYFVLQLLGMWHPSVGRGQCSVIWQLYSAFVHLLWLAGLVAIMFLDFVHYGFKDREVHIADLMNSVPTCLNLLCPFVFTKYYLKRGQFVQLLLSIQNSTSDEYQARLRHTAHLYTGLSLALWTFAAAFFIFHWTPFFSTTWHYIVYVIIIIYTTGWWAVWLSIYGFVCQVHTLQIDNVVNCITSKDCGSTVVLYKHLQLQNSLERTQKDFNIIISFALVYHTVDIIIFSFAYFDSAFGKHYELWQYVGGIMFDLVSILIKLCPPAVVAAAIHRIVTQAAKRCQMHVTPLTTSLPLEDMHLFQYIANCERDMGLKILGICVTVELVGTILMTISTAAVSFVAFVVPRLK